MPTVIIPFPLRHHTDNQREVVVDGESLKETMDGLMREHPGLETINHDSALLSIFVNSKLVNAAVDEWDSFSLDNKDEVTLIIPIAGG